MRVRLVGGPDDGLVVDVDGRRAMRWRHDWALIGHYKRRAPGVMTWRVQQDGGRDAIEWTGTADEYRAYRAAVDTACRAEGA